MEEIWMNACRNLEISDDIARPWYERIRQKMVQGSGRFYHNWDELLLRKENYLRDVSSNVLFAVFFQYYEFDGKRNCVEKNCEAFDEFCSNAGLKDAPMAKIVRKLLGDESIEPLPDTEGEAYLLQDLDLLVLGSSEEEYKRYTELLRKEYLHLDDDSYKQMRLKVTDPRPSTSREAGQKNSKRSPIKSGHQIKPFVKFKDNKHKIRTKKCITQTNRKQLLYGYSPSQIVSNKILRTIKRKRNLSPKKQIATKNRLSICDLTEKEVAKNESESKDEDDDCVLIDTTPEIILIDDETAFNCDPLNVENGLDISNVSNLGNISEMILKSYQPIGSVSSNYQGIENNFYKTLHSTPKLILNDNTRYPIAPRYKRTMPMIVETTPNALGVDNLNVETNEPVFIEDTIGETARNQTRKINHEDDSVIFVSEVTNKLPALTADFIPLNTPTEKYPIRTQEPKSKRQRKELFSSKEQKQLRQYNENAYNPNKDDPTAMTKKRMVIVDGSNVAYHHALNKEFSVKGLKICLEYFEKLGHEVKAVVPQFRLQKLKSTDPAALEKLHEEGKIVLTPCKNLPGKSSSSYDDRFILQLAAELDAAIVSNDNYRDLLHENPAFRKIIENRVVGFSWCNDLFILPKDPYGKWGPALSTILNRL